MNWQAWATDPVATFACLLIVSKLSAPVVLILGFPAGIWARRSGLAPRLGRALTILCTLLLATLVGIRLFFMVFPPGYSDPGLSALAPDLIATLVGGPLSLLCALALVVALATALVARSRRAREPA